MAQNASSEAAQRCLSPPSLAHTNTRATFSIRSDSRSPSSDIYSRSRSRVRRPLLRERQLSDVLERPRTWIDQWKFRKDHRADLPPLLSRFLGYRKPGQVVHPPLPFFPFTYIRKISPLWEGVIFAWLGTFGGLLLVESVMIRSQLFESWSPPLVIGSFGATAVLIYCTIESPLAQPRNLFFGHMLSALVSVAITKLFRLSSAYRIDFDVQPDDFQHLVWLNVLLVTATSISVMQLTGTVHPPGGATALIAAVQPNVVTLAWRYLFVIFVSCVLMLGWAVFINNLGRRRYPVYWWSPKPSFVFVVDEKTRLEELSEEEDRISEMRIAEESPGLFETAEPEERGRHLTRRRA